MDKVNGKIAIVNKEVIVTDPKNGGDKALLLPNDKVNIFVNDSLLKNLQAVTSADQIRLEPKDTVLSEGRVNIKVDQDKLKAYMKAEPRIIITGVPPSHQEEAHQFKVKSENENKKQPPATSEDVIKMFKSKEITFGILEDSIKKTLEDRPDEFVVVAEGDAPIPGKDAEIELFFMEKRVKFQPTNEKENIDYRDKGEIPSVDEGTLLAKVTPPEVGEKGKNIMGQEIPPPEPKRIVLKAKKGAKLSDDGLEAFSTNSGRPVVEGSTTVSISVMPVHQHNGDVNISTGHIEFKGNVSVNGRVTEEMKVIATGDIEIYDSVVGGYLEASKSIKVHKNVINSNVVAGATQAYIGQLLPHLEILEEEMQGLFQSYQKLSERPEIAKHRFGYIINLLIEKKHPRFPNQLEKAKEVLMEAKKKKFPKEFTEPLLFLKSKLEKLEPVAYLTGDKALEIYSELTYVRENLKDEPQGTSSIEFGYCNNSKIESSGDVKVLGQGSYHSDILAHGRIQVNGMVRGGKLTSRKNMDIKEVGSNAAVITHLIVPEDQNIKIQKAFENTTLQIGKMNYKFTTVDNEINARIDKESGMIVLR